MNLIMLRDQICYKTDMNIGIILNINYKLDIGRRELFLSFFEL